MDHETIASIRLWPFAVYFAAVVGIVAGMAIVAHFAGERRPPKPREVPYESGMDPTGSTHLRLSVSYYLISMFFLIFDLEAAFIFVWAVSLRQCGWPAFFEMLLFVAILMAGLIYLWRQGGLDMRRPSRLRTIGASRRESTQNGVQ
jgi:NADH-quinone oxidoreductase subunit A